MVAPDSKDFLNRAVENVPFDELFMYKYFHEKLERKGGKWMIMLIVSLVKNLTTFLIKWKG